MNTQKEPIVISRQALQRMPLYLQYLKKLSGDGIQVIAAPAIAEYFGLTDIQVRKDFAAVSTTKGKPKSGFPVIELIRNMEGILGHHNSHDAVLVGAGSLGKALLSYSGFDGCGLHIVTAFDTDEAVIGTEIGGKKILSADRLVNICRRLNIKIGIVAVPADQAQNVCDQLVSAGILAIWNFAPAHITVSKDILVQNENMASSIALIMKHLQEKNI